jgi:hypothetical protein
MKSILSVIGKLVESRKGIVTLQRGNAIFRQSDHPANSIAAMKTPVPFLAVLLGSAVIAAADDWQELFNGRDLTGWRVACREADRGKSYWQVRDGAIECNTAGDRNHDYVWLVSEGEFGDFEFECLVESFAGSTGNSGIQIRSRFAAGGQGGGWMHGPQVDIHPPSPWRCGLIYDETEDTRRWIFPSLPDWRMEPDQGAAQVRWRHRDGAGAERGANSLRIVARGPRVDTFVNGAPVARFDGTGILDDAAHRRHQVGLSGHLALQLHARDDLRIRFSRLRIRALPPPDQASPVVVARDDNSLAKALTGLQPGAVVRIAPGTYQPGRRLAKVHGTADQPVVIEGLDPRSPPLFEGGSQAWHLSDVSHLQMRWLAMRGQRHNGLNLDDGGTFDTPSHHIELAHLRVEDTGPAGNFDAIKCSGVEHLRIVRCVIRGWGGQAIDFVGVHHAEIAHCLIAGKPGFSQHTGPQFKGGSADVHIHHCRFEHAGMRPIQAGGSTGLEFFRPPDAPHEAARIRITDNVIIGGDCAVAFTGARDCVFSNNTVAMPEKWILRILQESRAPRFAACGGVEFSNNTIVFERAKVRSVANIGPGTEPASFRFAGNRWFARDAPDLSRPDLPVAETGGVYGIDPGEM